MKKQFYLINNFYYIYSKTRKIFMDITGNYNIPLYNISDSATAQSNNYNSDRNMPKDSIELSKNPKKENGISRFFSVFKKKVQPKTIMEEDNKPAVNDNTKKEIASVEADYIKQAKAGNLAQADFKHWADDIYNRIRKIDVNNIVKNDKLQYIVDNPSVKGIKVLNQKGWAFRSAKGFNGVKDRASLNVKNSPELIKELDMFMKTGRYTVDGVVYQLDNMVDFYYKTPEDVSKWYTREDPVSVYFLGNVNSETYTALANITAKYRNDALHNGENQIIDWFMCEESPDGNKIIPLINEAKKVSPVLAECIYNQATNYGKYDYGTISSYSMSAGIFEAYKEILEKLK